MYCITIQMGMRYRVIVCMNIVYVINGSWIIDNRYNI